MAKVDGGALSMGVSGTIGGLMTFSTWKGRPYVRKRVIPSNPNTAAQIGVRAGFKFCSQEWAELDAAEQLAWDTLAKQKNYLPFNAFVSAGQTRIRDGLMPQIIPGGQGTAVTDAPTSPSDAVVGRNVVLSWVDPLVGTLFGIAVYIDTTTGFTPAIGNLKTIADAGDLTIQYGPLDPGTYYYVLKGFGEDGALGPGSTEGSFVIT